MIFNSYCYQCVTGVLLPVLLSMHHGLSTSCITINVSREFYFLYRYQHVTGCLFPVLLSTRHWLSTSCIAINRSWKFYFLYHYQRVTGGLLPVSLLTNNRRSTSYITIDYQRQHYKHIIMGLLHVTLSMWWLLWMIELLFCFR